MQEYRKFICDKCSAVIYLKEITYQKAIEIIKQSKNQETGGILIGRYSSSLNDAYITELGNPPEDSSSGFCWFIRGIKGLGDYLKIKWSQNEEYYLGEWHYHPANQSVPSSTDKRQLKKISIDARFNCKEPILLIISKNKESYNIDISLFIGSNIYKYYE